MRALRHTDTRSSLLQLSRQDTRSDTETDRQTFVDNSIITQVTSRDSAPAGPRRPAEGEDAVVVETRSSWKMKFRSLLCCLAPSQNDQYFQHTETGPTVIRPHIRAPSPPRITGHVLGPLREEDKGKKCLVLDLDETLVHSSFKPIPNPDYIIPVEIEGKIVDVYVLKRPWLDHFMEIIGPRFEIVVFTASLSKYADPLLDLLDKSSVVRWRLFRESCSPYEGNYVKDLLCLGRDLRHSIIVDNSPHSYVFQPENAVPIGTFIDDMEDQELLDILPVLLALEKVDDVREHLKIHIQNMQAAVSQRRNGRDATGMPAGTVNGR